MRMCTLKFAAAVLVMAFALWRLSPYGGAAFEKAPRPGEVEPVALAMVGTPSCSARGCHGGIEPRTGQICGQNEFTLWLANDDPHARAFQVLSEKRAKDIAANLKIADPATDVRCLACHTTPWAAVGDANAARTERGFGAGCESCHGPAQKWLVPHTRTDTWRKLSAREKLEDFGMMDVADPFTRAGMCVGCHVGAPADNGAPRRDVNHDLIAAGHPRMQFETMAFHANLPPHWQTDTPERKARKSSESWAAGQIVAAQATLRLLEDRAAQPAWPEFAEYSCYACHHDLAEKSTRQERYLGWARQRPDFLAADWKPGRFPWGSWYITGPRLLAGPGRLEVAPVRNALLDLERAMSASVAPDPAAISSKARKAHDDLAYLARKIREGKLHIGIIDNTLSEFVDRRNHAADWETAEQAFLACTAMQGELGIAAERLKTLMPLRTFPQGFDSPKEFRPDEFWDKLRKIIAK